MININELTLEEKIGQMFMVGLQRTDAVQKIDDLINKDKVGGFIIYKRNYKDYKSMIEFVNNIKEKNKQNKVPLFISIDQEGGRVNRMPSEISNIKSATKIANTKNMELVKRSGKIIGNMLRKTGVFMDYAPTLDIKRFNEEHAIGDRCFGENKDDVSKYGIEVMKQMQQEKVIPVIKHFPGHGATQKDSHFKIPKVTQKIQELEQNDMAVFENAIKQGADAIMVGHLIVKDVDKVHPASLSKKIINKYLIEKYNYKGLIITDDLKMMAVRLRYSMKKATFKALEAGNDIVMIGLSYNRIKAVIKYITKKVETGKISEERINRSVEKILKMKEKYNINDNKVEGFEVDKINKEIDFLNKEVEDLNKKA